MDIGSFLNLDELIHTLNTTYWGILLPMGVAVAFLVFVFVKYGKNNVRVETQVESPSVPILSAKDYAEGKRFVEEEPPVKEPPSVPEEVANRFTPQFEKPVFDDQDSIEKAIRYCIFTALINSAPYMRFKSDLSMTTKEFGSLTVGFTEEKKGESTPTVLPQEQPAPPNEDSEVT